MRRRDWLQAILAATVAVFVGLMLTACGGTTVKTTTQVKVASPHEGKLFGEGPVAVVTTPLIPAAAIGASLPTARVPEGAEHGAARLHSQFLQQGQTLPLTLIGGQIHLDSHGATLIENFEEVQKAVYCPYWDAYGHVWTRGFGETDWGGNFGGHCISHAQATTNLTAFVESKYMYAVRSLGINLNQCQINALASFSWNLGPGLIGPGGSLHAAMQRREWGRILGYVIAGGQVLPGLVSRRHVEYSLLAGHCSIGPAETPAQHAARVHRERVKKLHGDYGRLRRLDAAIAANHCLNPHGYRGYSKRHREACITWRGEHAAVSRDIKRLRGMGIR